MLPLILQRIGSRTAAAAQPIFPATEFACSMFQEGYVDLLADFEVEEQQPAPSDDVDVSVLGILPATLKS